MDYELHTKRFFENLGYQAEKITEGNEKSPDFLIFDNESRYVVELKTKFASTEEIQNRHLILSSGKIHEIHETVNRKNLLSGIITKANKQLEKFNAENVFKIAFLLATGHLAELRILQYEATLYGSTCMISSKGSSDCYFFYNSDFFRYRNSLDGAIVSTETEANLLLNPLSPRYNQFKNSSLSQLLGDAVIDPIQLERSGKAFLVDSDLDRNNKEQVLKYLREKYRIDDLMDLPMTYLSGTLFVPDSDNMTG